LSAHDKNVDEWTLSLTSEHRLALSTIRTYQDELRLFSEYLMDARADLPRVGHHCSPGSRMVSRRGAKSAKGE
jgi:site-specific recombinase XerD